MKNFSQLLRDAAYHMCPEASSVSGSLGPHTLYLRFDAKDVLVGANYIGGVNPWLSSLCYLAEGKTLAELQQFSWATWESAFRDDQSFWDHRQEEADKFFFPALELLKLTLDLYRGREYLYAEAGPLVCRCFGVRESDILAHLQTEASPTLETLAGVSKAGLGCRSCVPQLKRWLVAHEAKTSARFYKNKPVADWLLDIDYLLSCFPKALDWKMEIASFRGKQVVITFDKEVTQREEETAGKELQDFLGAAVDAELAFFLRRARHFSNARG
jgi:hypothetical protein